jgi:cysteine desulfurase
VEHFYFDHNATTPVSPEVLEAVLPCLDQAYGNASSIHHFGQIAKQRLEQARRQVAGLLHCDPREVVFTGGGTEADNMAVLGAARGGHVITSTIEHTAVLSPCAQLERQGVAVTRVGVGSAGVVDPEDVRRALRKDTTLISIMHANNELGTLQPCVEIAKIARESGVLFHADGVQALGKTPVDVEALGVDLYTISGHKVYAPKGAGALYMRKGVKLAPILFGGHHERDRRPGTENVAGAVGLGAAAEWLSRNQGTEWARVAALRDRLESGILARVGDAVVNGAGVARTANTSNIRFDFIEGEALVIALDLRGFAVSSGAACSSGAVEPSHVLLAIGLPAETARSSIRFSLGRSNTVEQVDALIEAVVESVAHLRRISVMGSGVGVLERGGGSPQ